MLNYHSEHLRRTATSAVILFLLSVVGSATGVSAQSTTSVSDQAKALGKEAVQLATNGNYELAITRFRAALEIAPAEHLVRFQLARLLAALGRYEEARDEFGTVVRAMPQNGAARRGEVTAMLLAGRYEDARMKLQEGLEALPQDGQLAHTLARLLASAPEDSVRDGQMAVRLATAVYSIKKIYETAETLAMAHAETGDFDQAVEIQTGLVARAKTEGDAARLEALELRLVSYQRREPWRAVSPAEIATATEPPDSGSGSQR